jgi:HPt (histidine-containing phosphotransfer) domain-containing protein
MQQAISTFVQATLATTAKIEAALIANDWDSLSRVAHQNKGSAGYMGAERVVGLALQVQADAKALLSSTNAARAEETELPVASVITLARCEALKRCLSEMAEHLAAMTDKE